MKDNTVSQLNQAKVENSIDNQFNQTNQESDGKKIAVVVLMIGVLMLCTTGATFAYFAVGAINNNVITGTAATVGLTLNVTKTLPASTSTNNGVIVPQLSTTATNSGPLQTALTGGCVDANSNIVCQVYTITITNTSTATVVLKGLVSFYTNTGLTAFSGMSNLKWKLITSTSTIGSTNTSDVTASMTAATFVNSVSLAPTNGSATYYMIVWINETGASQTDKGTYYGKIEFASSNGTGVTSTFTT